MKQPKFSMSFVAFALVILCPLLLCQTPSEARGIALHDLSHRDTSIRWPPGFDPASAAQFSHNELFIPAPCSHVFAKMADATRWPQWLILVKDVRWKDENRPTGVGSELALSIFGTPIVATITEWIPGERMSWLPTAVGPNQSRHYHAWLFKPAAGGCNAITEEVGIGPDDKRSGPDGSFYMHRAHDLWLASLRFASE